MELQSGAFRQAPAHSEILRPLESVQVHPHSRSCSLDLRNEALPSLTRKEFHRLSQGLNPHRLELPLSSHEPRACRL